MTPKKVWYQPQCTFALVLAGTSQLGLLYISQRAPSCIWSQAPEEFCDGFREGRGTETATYIGANFLGSRAAALLWNLFAGLKRHLIALSVSHLCRVNYNIEKEIISPTVVQTFWVNLLQLELGSCLGKWFGKRSPKYLKTVTCTWSLATFHTCSWSLGGRPHGAAWNIRSPSPVVKRYRNCRH